MIDQATSHKDAIRPAVTVLVLRDNPLRVLMVKRHPGAFLGSSLTFPGGVVETQDGSPDWLAHVTGAAVLDPEERARRIAACRETFEESGVLLTAPKARPQPGAGDFLQQVSACGARLALGRLQPFAHWITPRGIPKRFDTRFYLCRASPNQTALCDGA
jgi:8-oxo-dGTP pyrophosphatase MutT (NUDIX family)